MPQFSICIPAYNRREGLEAAITSVLEQTHDDVEVIVTDDSDEPHASDLFRDHRVHYQWNPQRLGMAANWQRALSLSSGAYVGLLMDDDRLMPTFLERCLLSFEADPRVGVVFTNHYFGEGENLRPRPSLLAEETYADFLPILLARRPVAVSAALMRREVWEKILPVPPLHTADMALHIRAAESGAVFRYLDTPLMVYGLHDSQLSGRTEFRDHEVELWRSVSFAVGSEMEELRRRFLAEALLSSASGRIRAGECEAARELGREAEATGVDLTRLRRRHRIAHALSRSRPAIACAAMAFGLFEIERLRDVRAAIRGQLPRMPFSGRNQ